MQVIPEARFVCDSCTERFYSIGALIRHKAECRAIDKLKGRNPARKHPFVRRGVR